MNYLPESEVINLKYQLAQQIKASINRAAANKNSNMPFLDSIVDILIDEMAELKIEISKLSLTLSGLKNDRNSDRQIETKSQNGRAQSSSQTKNGFLAFPIQLNPEYLQNIDNFYYPEATDKGNTYIWMGPENKVSFDIPLPFMSPIEIILRNVRFITDDLRESLQILVNGKQLNIKSLKQDEGYTISASWLPLYTNTEKCTVEIRVERSVSVRELYPETSDSRKLCFALSEIEIKDNTQEYVNT